MPLFKKISDLDFQGYLSFRGNTQVHRLLPVTSNGVTCDKKPGASAVTSDNHWCYLGQVTIENIEFRFCKEVE